LFHQVCDDVCGPKDTYGVTRRELERMLRTLRESGYESVSIDDYVRGVTGRRVLLTFDDSRADAYRGADPVLRATRMRATMFAITDGAERRDPFHMSWSELAEAQGSGRWDVQLHAHRGHTHVDTGASKAPFYANRQPDESLEVWRGRVTRDLEEGISLLRGHVPGFAPLAFAVPFGDYGQKGSNDDAIAPAFRRVLDDQFPVWFTQDRAPARTDTHERFRFTVLASTTTAEVLAWLEAVASGSR